jgi:nucleotide-binding universal stress UspA family protein
VKTKLRRILAAVDFSETARAAFDRALALSRLHRAELLVVHAVPKDRPFSWGARERVALIGSLRHAAATATVDFKVSIQHGDAAGVILLHAKAREADLIVLGNSQRSGLDRLRVGSVAETVSREATTPVLVVPSASSAAGASMPPFKNILAAVDLGDGSRETVESALGMAGATSDVTVVHVIPGAPLGFASRRLSHRMEADYQRHLVRDAWQKISEMIPTNARSSRNVRVRVVTGDRSIEIPRIAAEIGADVILLGVTARGVIGRLLFGSTAARVIRTAARPVLAIPQLPGRASVRASDEDQLALAA